MDKIKRICEIHGAILIEDAAEAMGATIGGRQCGSFGDYSAISYNGNKIITGSAGGCLLTNSLEDANRARKWATQARENAPWYQHEEVGYNYRMSNVIAGVIRGQYLHLEEHIQQKKAVYEKYKEGLKDLPVTMNPICPGTVPNYWLSALIIDKDYMCPQVRGETEALFTPEKGKSCPTEILNAIASINAEGRPIWKPMHFDNGLKIDLNIPEDVNCVLWCNYFGFEVAMPDMSEFIRRGGIIIEDITHSFYSHKQSHEQSLYLVASLRKWEPIICGGYCASYKGVLEHCPEQEPSEHLLALKKKAMDMKASYLSGDTSINKSEFLQMFSDSNYWLANNYSGLSIDTYSREYLLNVDCEAHRQQRIRNARVLYEGLKDNSEIKFLFPLDIMDCPLFVPIIISDGKRDLIRKKLIDYDIYCPVHWPHPNAGCESNLYDKELSLICDQRYNENDMKRIVSVICEK